MKILNQPSGAIGYMTIGITMQCSHIIQIMPIYPKFGCQLLSKFRVHLLQCPYLLGYGRPWQRTQADLTDFKFSRPQSE